MRALAATWLVSIGVVGLSAGRAHADEPPPAALRLELGAGVVDAKQGLRVPVRLGFGVRLSPGVSLVADFRHAFVEDTGARGEAILASYDDLSLGVRFASTGTTQLFFTPMLTTGWFSYDSYVGGHGAESHTSTGKGATLRTGVEHWLGGSMWGGAALVGSFVWSSEDLVEIDAGGELYLALRF